MRAPAWRNRYAEVFGASARRFANDAAASGSLGSYFDPSFYLARYPDVRKATRNGLRHYVNHGETEGREPSVLFNPDYLRRALERQGRPLGETPPRVSDIDNLCDVNGLIGPSGLVCPAWLQAQLPEKAKAMGDLLESPIPSDVFSLHPSLRRAPPPQGAATIAAALRAIGDDYIRDTALIDMDAYLANHSDLLASIDSPIDAFLHLWNIGLFENRLKPLSVGVPRTAPFDHLLLTQFSAIYRQHLLDTEKLQGSAQRLPAESVTFVDQDAPVVRDLLAHDTKSGAEPPSLDTFTDLAAYVEAGSAKPIALVRSAPAVSVPRSLTDRDLLLGTHDLTSRRVVYAVNIGGYDNISDPPGLPDTDYVLISDARPSGSGKDWRWVRPTFAEPDAKRTCLWYKTHPHRLFSGVDVSIWMDSNIVFLPGAEDLLQSTEALAEVATFAHPDRNCVYDEAASVKKLKLDHADVVDAVVERLKADDVPAHGGLFETNVLLARCPDPCVQDFMETWWRLIALGSRRDQLSFTHAAHLTGIEISRLDGQQNVARSRFFDKSAHRRSEGRLV